jgi:hypothetical protein
MGKIPARGVLWKETAASDEHAVRSLFEGRTDFNVGLVVPIGALVLDLDVKKDCDGAANLRALRPGFNPEAHDGPLARTGGGGLHLWYSLPAGVSCGNSPGRLPAGCDVRSNGCGYVIVAPSTHPETGLPYRWLRPLVPVAELPLIPMWLMGLIQPAPRPAYVPRETGARSADVVSFSALLSAVRAASQGCRNATLNRAAYTAAGAVAGRGGDLCDLRDALADAALASGLPPWEVKKTLDSALAAGAARPLVAADTQRGFR